jgi:hypothetical protein
MALLTLALSFYVRYFAAVVALGFVLALAIWLSLSAARWWREH